MISTLLNFNYLMFQSINAPAGSNPVLDLFMVFCANSLIFCFPLILLFYWGKPLSWQPRSLSAEEMSIVQQRRSAVLWIAIACVLAFSLNLLIEHFIFEPRPFIAHKVHLLIQHAADGSFPSDHTAWSFAVVGMLAFQLLFAFTTIQRSSNKGQGNLRLALLLLPFCLLLIALGMACLIGFARIYVGVHYPGDILGGACSGMLASCIATALRLCLQRPTEAVIKLAQAIRLA
ncbi:phosphatase PAP2 family protein [Ktedonosporobacter rubrisoli]|uniref:Phosphatase PAP2 family protein n=1 Tax=Ktedonosporobacter rubrisoli TaxID=2509675 RepID=A0A4P6JI39_KTERU|nr:phosphatase PAP2 family protein [Ktedonosporobacter rubrisoli]QBD74719.1 phosphatase PAP2 family protein [Ktedonosporobacter rubrisoli]